MKNDHIVFCLAAGLGAIALAVVFILVFVVGVQVLR